MNRKNLPLILMLTAGAITCIITIIRDYPIMGRLLSLLIVLIVFYLLGSILKWLLDYFDQQNAKNREASEGDVIEKEPKDEGEQEKHQG